MNFLPAQDYRPFPRYQDRQAWQSVSPHVRSFYLQKAESALSYHWPPLLATLYMDFVRNGNRSRYEAVFTTRRKTLFQLLMAECLEAKGRFVDSMINGIWALCEETTWSLPAHNFHVTKSWTNALPEPWFDSEFIDLACAETGSLLSWVSYFLSDVLDAQSPLIGKRLRHELETRIIHPFMNSTAMWWMGFGDRRVNNWNPWIVSNVLPVLALSQLEDDQRQRALSKAIQVLDFFIAGYPEDGGCDEGPGYWNAAGGSMFDCLEILSQISPELNKRFSQVKIRNMASYVYKAHIGHGYFVNFADAPLKANPDASLIFRVGSLVNDASLSDFGASLFDPPNALDSVGGHLWRTLKRLWAYDEITQASQEALAPLLADVWLKDLQFVACRQQAGSTAGLYWAAKGGHNDESHNHNDVGNFLVFWDCLPVIIDVGVETYTAKTFSPQRYDIWTMQSSYHNVPEINGCMQAVGACHKANKLVFDQSDIGCTLGFDLHNAYPDTASLVAWRREFSGQRTPEPALTITDQFNLQTASKHIVWNFMLAQEPLLQNGQVSLAQINGQTIVLEFNSQLLIPNFEEIPLQDAKLIADWERSSLYRLQFSLKEKILNGEMRFIIHQA